jgi:L-asparaginase/Glu-tRNA(Gln) amidotransferase subunit D
MAEIRTTEQHETLEELPRTPTRIGIVAFGGSISHVTEGEQSRPLKDLEDFKTAMSKAGNLIPRSMAVEPANFYDINQGDTLERTPTHLELLCQTLNRIQTENDAILILDGPDAIAMDGAAATYALGANLKVPFNFVVDHDELGASYKSAELAISRGLSTLRTAHYQGVKAVMAESGDGKILRASRAIKIDDHGYPILTARINYGFMGERSRFNMFVDKDDPERTDEVFTKFDFDRIGHVPAFVPGYNPRHLMDELRAGHYSALIVTSTETGRMPKALHTAITDDYIRRVPVLIQTEHIQRVDIDSDEQMQDLEEVKAGAIPIRDMTHPAALVKTAWILGQGIREVDEFRKAFYTDYGDITV